MMEERLSLLRQARVTCRCRASVKSLNSYSSYPGTDSGAQRGPHCSTAQRDRSRRLQRGTADPSTRTRVTGTLFVFITDSSGPPSVFRAQWVFDEHL